jgi:hypothetical protein
MRWRRVCRDIPEGEPILVSDGARAVVALAFAGDSYFPDMTFMDARTFDILPKPTHWMPLPERPLARAEEQRAAPAPRRAA